MGERREVTLAQHGREKGGNISTIWEGEGEDTLATTWEGRLRGGGGGAHILTNPQQCYMYYTLVNERH